jgi:hypothetical protein
MRGGNGAAGQWGNKMKRLFASAALVAAVIASPASGQDKKDIKETLGFGLALMKVAPALCGTSSSEIAIFVDKVKAVALIKNWKMGDLEAIRDRAIAQHGGNFSKIRSSTCETVAALTETANGTSTASKEKTVAGPPMAEIKAKCAGDWPDNYVMQEWCIGNQIEAWTKVEQF